MDDCVHANFFRHDIYMRFAEARHIFIRAAQ